MALTRRAAAGRSWVQRRANVRCIGIKSVPARAVQPKRDSRVDRELRAAVPRSASQRSAQVSVDYRTSSLGDRNVCCAAQSVTGLLWCVWALIYFVFVHKSTSWCMQRRRGMCGAGHARDCAVAESARTDVVVENMWAVHELSVPDCEGCPSPFS